MFTYVRAGAAAAALAAALLTGCSSDSGAGEADGGTPSEAASGTSAPSEGKGGAEAVAGVWTTKTDNGVPTVLSIASGNAALLGEQACTGSVTGQQDVTIKLTCPGGDTTRSSGRVTAADDGKTLTVDWGKGVEDTFTKSADGKLPEGVPTELPSSLGEPTS